MYFDKACLNYNGLSLIKYPSLLQKFSGSERFFYNNHTESIELRERKKTFSEASTFQDDYQQFKNDENFYFGLPFNSSYSRPATEEKTYKLNKTILSRRLVAFFTSKLCKKGISFFSISFPKNCPDDLCFKIWNIALTRLRKGYDVGHQADIMLKKYDTELTSRKKEFLKLLSKSSDYQKLNNYVWVTERQENGTLHYHLITNDKINVLYFNDFVAESLSNFKEKGEAPNILVNFCKSKYNGVDISKKKTRINNYDTLKKYITKYVTKNNCEFKHLAWHNSRIFTMLFTSKQFSMSEVRSNEFLIDINKVFQYTYITESFCFFFIPDLDFNKLFSDLIDLNNSIIDTFL